MTESPYLLRIIRAVDRYSHVSTDSLVAYYVVCGVHLSVAFISIPLDLRVRFLGIDSVDYYHSSRHTCRASRGDGRRSRVSISYLFPDDALQDPTHLLLCFTPSTTLNRVYSFRPM